MSLLNWTFNNRQYIILISQSHIAITPISPRFIIYNIQSAYWYETEMLKYRVIGDWTHMAHIEYVYELYISRDYDGAIQ